MEHLSADLDANNVDYTCMYPIHPWVVFEDYLAASKMEPRIIPFTSADWTIDPDEAGKKLLKDVRNGAKGLKIHPIFTAYKT